MAHSALLFSINLAHFFKGVQVGSKHLFPILIYVSGSFYKSFCATKISTDQKEARGNLEKTACFGVRANAFIPLSFE
jgi:hypothetical protein